MVSSAIHRAATSRTESQRAIGFAPWHAVKVLAGLAATAFMMAFLIATDVPDKAGLVLNDARFIAMNCGDKVGPYTIRRDVGWVGQDSISVSINGLTVLANSIGGNKDKNRKGHWREQGPWETGLAPLLAKQREICMASVAANGVAVRAHAVATHNQAVEQAAIYERSVKAGATDIKPE